MQKEKKPAIWIVLLILLVLPVIAHSQKPDAKEASPTAQPTHTEILADYVVQAKFTDFPGEVVTMAKYLIMDNVGCMLGATQSNWGKKYLALGKSMSSGGTECTILGSGDKVSRNTALYINGQLSNLLDFDDTYDFYAPVHLGINLVPLALTIGEAVGASGEEMLTAVILGYETCMHVGTPTGNRLWNTHFIYPMELGSAVVAARLMHLDKKQVADALRQAGLWGSQPKRRKKDVESNAFESEVKNYAGERSLVAVMNVCRAQQGFGYRPYLLDGDFKQWYLAGGSLEAFDTLTSQLGKTYRILDMGFKPTPSCRFSHPAVTALWQALDYRPVKEEDVEEIVFKGVVRLDHPEWGNEMLEAQFSMYCILSLTALGVEAGPQWYVTGRFNDPDVRALAKKIKLVNDPAAEKLEMQEKLQCSVTVKFKDGTVKEATIHHMKGTRGNPMTDDEHKAKFRANTRGIFADDQVTRVIEMLMSLEKVPRISALTKLLVSSKL